MATYHDPYNGNTWEDDGSEGDFEVVSPGGHVLSYESLPGEAKSTCICPICSKVFAVDLVHGADDADPGVLGFNNSGNLINFYMVI